MAATSQDYVLAGKYKYPCKILHTANVDGKLMYAVEIPVHYEVMNNVNLGSVPVDLKPIDPQIPFVDDGNFVKECGLQERLKFKCLYCGRLLTSPSIYKRHVDAHKRGQRDHSPACEKRKELEPKINAKYPPASITQPMPVTVSYVADCGECQNCLAPVRKPNNDSNVESSDDEAI